MREILNEDIQKIASLCSRVLGANQYEKLERLGGLTNHTYYVRLHNGSEYVVRIPGEGTQSLINRMDEKVSTELACRLGVDARMLFFGKDGSKVSKYIKNAETMSAETMREPERIPKVSEILRTIHGCGVNTGVAFNVFDMAKGYEKIINDLRVGMFDDYDYQKNKVMQIKAMTDNQFNPKIVPCHNDPLCENWVQGSDKLYLIDWEYAGMNDAMWDLAAVSIEACYDEYCDNLLLESYLSCSPSSTEKKHFLAAKIFVDYLWTLWAKARVPYSGQDMEDWAQERYQRMKQNIVIFESI